MFANLGWGEMLVLVIIGLVVLGPERLPGAIRWTAGTVKQARDYISGATSQLRDDLGPEFDDLRQPLSELQKLRGMTPRAAITKHLLDGDDSFLTGNFDGTNPPKKAIDSTAEKPADIIVAPGAALRSPAAPESDTTVPPGERPTPFDSDAT